MLILLLILNLGLLVAPAMAQDYYDQSEIPQIKNPLQKTAGVAEATTAKGQVAVLTGNIIAGVMSVVGSISLLMFIYAGIRFMMARGNADESKKAMQIMVWAALGLLVIFSSYIILRFVFDVLA